MYRACIFCTRPLGRNELVGAFPVGERLAFDSWRGRLWVICPRCHRWNLAPIEERWEAVEQAEEHFRAARTRVQSENIGLARLPDGTRLVRIGKALPGELAAWRYGDRLVRRRAAYLWWMGAAAAGGVALLAGAPVLAAAGVPLTLISAGLQVGAQVHQRNVDNRVIARVPAADSPNGAEVSLRRHHLWDARISGSGAGLLVNIPDALAPEPLKRRVWGGSTPPVPLELRGEGAERLVARALVACNERGGSRDQVRTALGLLEQAGSATDFIRSLGAEGRALRRRRYAVGSRGTVTPAMIVGTFRGRVIPVKPYRSPFFDDTPALSSEQALALEMALHEEAERLALEGELAELRAAWREAEEIAGIADALPDEPQLPPA